MLTLLLKGWLIKLLCNAVLVESFCIFLPNGTKKGAWFPKRPDFVSDVRRDFFLTLVLSENRSPLFGTRFYGVSRSSEPKIALRLRVFWRSYESYKTRSALESHLCVAFAFGYHAFQKGRWFELGPVGFFKLLHLGEHFVEADLGPIEHGAAAIDRPAIAIDPDNIDVAGADRFAFFEDLEALIDHRIDAAFQDFIIRDVPAGVLGLLREFDDDVFHFL